jgi:hypothetical protein
MLPIAAIIGGILYRLRGGVLKDLWPHIFGTQLSRLAWALPTAALMTEKAHLPAWWAIPLTVSNFAALAFIGTGQYLTDKPIPRIPDLLGTARTAIAGLPLAFIHPLLAAVYAISGATHAHLYWLGFRTPWGSQAGEVLVGAVCWSTIILWSFL